MSANSLGDLYLVMRNRLMRTVGGIVPPREVEDIVQEAYVRLCQVKDAESIQAPHSYLLTTVRNLAIDHIKRAESRLSDSLEDNQERQPPASETSQNDTFQHVAAREEFALFCEAVRHLPVQCRRAFVLRKVYGYSLREIAREMGVSESTVEKHIALGIRRCANFLDGERNTPSTEKIKQFRPDARSAAAHAGRSRRSAQNSE